MSTAVYKIILLSLFILLFGHTEGYGQLSITGPSCIIAGTTYQYDVIKDPLDSSDMQVCITGGVIAASDSTCRNGQPFTFIRVIWNDTTQGSITLNTSVGNASINVNMTRILAGGNIDSTLNFQTVGVDSIPSAIHCSAATGGSCSPAYNYQWQQSVDGMNWNNIVDAVSQDLVFSAALTQGTYYRRKVTESVSGSENFSDMATIMINTQTTVNP